MSSLNKVIQFGRLTRDPEFKSFNGGGAVCKLGLAVNDRKKNKDSGEWEDSPMFIDVEVYDNGENGKAATNANTYLKKGNRVLVEGKLVLEGWDDKTTGAKRSKHKIVAFNVVYIDKNEDAPAGGGRGRAPEGGESNERSQGEEIPF